MRLSGKTAVVTGAGSGIGRASAVLFAKEGARVLVHSRRKDHAEAAAAEIETLTGQVVPVVFGPIESEETSKRIAATSHAEFGVVDVLVPNAGVDDFHPVDVVRVEVWDTVLATNLRGAFLVCRAILPIMRRPGGSIVHIASASALVGTPGMAAYSASKGGMVSLARQMATDYAREAIRVNVICPGSINTPMLRAGFASDSDPLAAEQRCIARHPLGRLGTAEDVAYGALYLASDEASFVTGSILVIDGGFTAI